MSTRLSKISHENEGEKADFFSHIVRNQGNESKALTRGEMDANAQTFLFAGSETTATTLAGTTYLLLANPDVYGKLVNEIRSAFRSQADITIEEVNKLPYLIAVFQEGLRHYPPISTGFPRVVPAGGDVISGHYIPGGTAVYVSQHAANHSARNWKDPERFVPERWLGEERYEGDRREVWNPFSFGPRNCLGRRYVGLTPSYFLNLMRSWPWGDEMLILGSLAYAEMRLILAKVLFGFNLELVDKERDWIREQKVFTLWDKGALMVTPKAVQQ